MAGGHAKYRHLNRHSAHRQSLLRNLVTSLIAHESITTSWPKAKEAQRLAEKVITLAKRNTDATRRRAQQILFTPLDHIPTLFTTLRSRYLDRPGGYTRVLRTEPRNRNDDQAPTAILELVDGPRDMRFAMTARTVMRERRMQVEDEDGSAAEEAEEVEDDRDGRKIKKSPRTEAGGIRDVTLFNIRKVTRFRPNGERELLALADRMEREDVGKEKSETGEKAEQERDGRGTRAKISVERPRRGQERGLPQGMEG